MLKTVWKKLRVYMRDNRFLTGVVAAAIGAAFKFIKATNKSLRDDGPKVDEWLAKDAPLIFTCWHGQHFMLPFLRRQGEPSAMMVSKSADAEINARIVEREGIEVMRGSGGRGFGNIQGKGGARALLALRNKLAKGRSVAFIADIPNGVPREAGLGIVTLAKISGRPIVPIAYATSRRYIFARSWDQATLSLPFGKSAMLAGEPVFVAADADNKALEDARALLQDRLNRITQEAYGIVDAIKGETGQ